MVGVLINDTLKVLAGNELGLFPKTMYTFLNFILPENCPFCHTARLFPKNDIYYILVDHMCHLKIL